MSGYLPPVHIGPVTIRRARCSLSPADLERVASNPLSSLPGLTHYLTDPPAQRALMRGKERLEPEHLLPTRCYRRVRA